MKLFAPDYYPDFVCTAGACEHNCCIGWEIDIDEKTYTYYKSVPGSMQKRLSAGIATDGDGPHFVLSENERCPFLNKNNLCDIILELGEDKLCQICRDHPRFRNFFGDRTEIGLGLCCSAAGRLILTRSTKANMILLEDEGENGCTNPEEEYFFLFREQVLAILQDRTKPIDVRIRKMCGEYDIVLPEMSYARWAEVYQSLAQLDSLWAVRIADLAHGAKGDFAALDGGAWELAFEQLMAYFLYRHLPDGLTDGRLWERMALAVHGYFVVRTLCAVHAAKYGAVTIEDLIEIARLYSSEIEYAQENMDTLLEILHGEG